MRVALIVTGCLLLAGCGTQKLIKGVAYEDAWFAAKEVLLEVDPQAVLDREKGRQLSEDREEAWPWDAARWLTLGAFGTTGDYYEIGLERVGDQQVQLVVKAGFEMVAGYVPFRWPRGATERELIEKIEARLAQRIEKGELQAERQIEQSYQTPPALEGNWDDHASRRRMLDRRLAQARRPEGPRRTDQQKEPQHPAPRAAEAGGDLAATPLRPPSGMALVAAGEFLMGSPRETDERPQRVVYLDAYYIDRHEVTTAAYREFVAWIKKHADHSRCHPDEPPGKDHVPQTWKSKQYRQFTGDRQPVVGVDWFDAYAYARWRGKRLPTEAEWEKAARGTGGATFPWGESFAARLANTKEAGGKATAEVGSYPGGKSKYGAHDMAGNAWEWCYDWYEKGYYRNASRENPQGPALGADRVLRGGSWAHPARMARAAYRNFGRPIVWSYYIGFRCAKSASR